MIKEQFIGKVCTIVTTAINMSNLNRMEIANIFTGKIEAMDEYGILVIGLNKLRSFFYHTQVVGILEEEVVSEDDPRVQKMLAKEKPVPVSLDALSNLVRK